VPIPESRKIVLFTLEKAVARKRRSTTAGGAALAPLVSVLGPKGGSGKTLVATNVAVALAEMGQRVVLVDLDLQFGDVGLALGIAPEKTIFDLARSSGTIDADKIEGYLEEHESGARVLLAPSRPDQASAVSTDFLRELYAVLRKTNDVVVLDTAPGFGAEAIASIDSSSDVVMVGMLDAPSLKSTKLGLQTLDLMGFDPKRVKIVLNRADTRVGITPEDVSAVLGRTPDVLVPSDRDVPRTINESRPIVSARRGSDAARALKSLAEQYKTVAGSARAAGRASANRRRGLLRRAA
jgi:pilus assembly protein CpaE